MSARKPHHLHRDFFPLKACQSTDIFTGLLSCFSPWMDRTPWPRFKEGLSTYFCSIISSLKLGTLALHIMPGMQDAESLLAGEEALLGVGSRNARSAHLDSEAAAGEQWTPWTRAPLSHEQFRPMCYQGGAPRHGAVGTWGLCNKVGQFRLIALPIAELKCHSTGQGSCRFFRLWAMMMSRG